MWGLFRQARISKKRICETMRILVANQGFQKCNIYETKLEVINMSVLIAVDHGNYATKTPNLNFVSGLIELSGKAAIHETDIVEYNN